MENEILEVTYLSSNHIDSLRYQLCDILYNDYKGTTFFLNQQLAQKKQTLKELHSFVKQHPEIYDYKNNSQYYYPYENVTAESNTSFFTDFYFTNNNAITYFGKEGSTHYEVQDYLIDPLKLQFYLMCQDISKMDCDSDTAKKIIAVNNQIFSTVLDIVGDTVSYQNIHTLGHIEKYIATNIQGQKDAENDTKHAQDYKDYMIRQYRRFNDHSHLIKDAISILEEYKLQNTLPQKTTNKVGNKI